MRGGGRGGRGGWPRRRRRIFAHTGDGGRAADQSCPSNTEWTGRGLSRTRGWDCTVLVNILPVWRNYDVSCAQCGRLEQGSRDRRHNVQSAVDTVAATLAVVSSQGNLPSPVHRSQQVQAGAPSLPTHPLAHPRARPEPPPPPFPSPHRARRLQVMVTKINATATTAGGAGREGRGGALAGEHPPVHPPRAAADGVPLPLLSLSRLAPTVVSARPWKAGAPSHRRPRHTPRWRPHRDGPPRQGARRWR